MNRRAIALRLSLIVALSGLLPIIGVGAISIEVMRRRLERSSQESLRALAFQAAERIRVYLEQQEVLAQSLAASLIGTKDLDARLQAAPLEAKGIRNIAVLNVASSAAKLPDHLPPDEVARVRKGEAGRSRYYISADLSPAMDVCLPLGGQRGNAVCATLDLLELWRLVQHIKVGESGYALAFDSQGKLLASGHPLLRGAVLSPSQQIPQAQAAVAAARSPETAPVRYGGSGGIEVLAGWSYLRTPGWSIVVEQPVKEALRGARAAQFTLGVVAIVALLLSMGVGIVTSMPLLTNLEVEERWRTAGRIATGITHDLGHRMSVLQQTVALAESNDPAFLPLIRDNLRKEVATLKKFVGDFADLSREVRTVDLMPLELNAFVESLRRTAQPQAEKASVAVVSDPVAGDAPWVRADRYLLERATLNLIYNAIEASPTNAIVTIRCGLQEPQRGSPPRAIIAVHDRGVGIAPERLPRIFDAFKSTKRTGAHVGMGLPNVHRIVTAHGGSVTVESEVGKGTTFTIALPLAPQDEIARAMGTA